MDGCLVPVAEWPNGRSECYAVAPGIPDLDERECQDAMPKGLYRRLEDDGVLIVEEGRRVSDPETLLDHLVGLGIQPETVYCDRFNQGRLRDAIGTAPGIPETVLCESRGHGRVFCLAIVRRFGLGRRPVPDRLEDATVIEPVHPIERGELHRLQASPRAAGSNHLGLVQPGDGLGQGVIVRIANAPDRLLDAGLGQAFGVADGEILRPSVAMMDQGVARAHHTVVQGLLERVERQVGAKRACPRLGEVVLWRQLLRLCATLGRFRVHSETLGTARCAKVRSSSRRVLGLADFSFRLASG